jgi:hypothetical protein
LQEACVLDPFKIETLAARSARLAQVAGEGYAAWLGQANEGMKEAAKAMSDLLACRSPGEAVRIQLGWIEAASRRNAGALLATLDYADAVAAALREVPAEPVPDPLPEAGPEPVPDPLAEVVPEPVPDPLADIAPEPAAAPEAEADAPAAAPATEGKPAPAPRAAKGRRPGASPAAGRRPGTPRPRDGG